MGYYLRTFCTAASVPKLRAVVDFVSERGYPLVIPTDYGVVDLNTTDWQQAEFTCERDRSRFVAETARDDGGPECLFGQEVAEFAAMISELRARAAKPILRHLRSSKYVVSTQILFDESGHFEVDAANVFLSYFEERCGGLLQADGEGFYRRGKLVLALE